MDPKTKQETKYKVKSLMNVLSDKVDVTTAKIRGEDGSDIDVAVVKATLNDEVVPKEKHVRTLKVACSGSQPRVQVDYAIHGLAKRMDGKPGWLVTLKTLIVFHRLMREVDPTFQEELLRYADKTGAHRLLRLDTFADHTTKDTWDLSAWIRVYSVYLDERLELFRTMKFDPEQEASQKESVDSKLKTCSAAELLDKLPQVQKLLNRLTACLPQGAAQNNEIVIQACGMVLRELRAIYKVVCEGIMNLADKFFEMERNDAMKGLELYKENIALNEKLNAYFAAINNIGSLKGSVQFPNLQALPTSFLQTLEEYVKDAPKTLDANATQSRNPANPPPAASRISTVAKQGGTTSAVIVSGGTGGVASGPVVPAPIQGVLKVGGPAAPAAPEPVDLLGDLADLAISPQVTGGGGSTSAGPLAATSSAASSMTTAAPPAAAAAADSFFSSNGWGVPSTSSAQNMYASQGMPSTQGALPANPFMSATFPAASGPAPPPFAGPTGQPGMANSSQGFPGASSFAAPPPAYGNQPGSFNPFSQGPAVAGPAAGTSNPFGAPINPSVQPGGSYPQAAATPAVGTTNPFGSHSGFAAPAPSPAPQAAPNPFGSPTTGFVAAPPAAPSPAGVNPFNQGANLNPFGSPAPATATAAPWPASASARRAADPLNDISIDLFGKQVVQKEPQPSLRDLKQPGASVL